MAITLETLLIELGTDNNPLTRGLGDAQSKVGGFAGKATQLLGGVLVGGAVAAGAAIAAIGTAAFSVSMQTDTAARDMAASLGIPIEEAEKFADVAKKVYGNNFADSVGDAALAVQELNRIMGVSSDDPALQNLAEDAFRLRDAFGVDVTESVSAAKTLMDNFGLSGDEAFNMIAAGYQKGLDRSGDFIDTIGEYSTQFSSGGASASEFFSLMESGLQGGMLGTDKAADAFKEFRLRLMDGSSDMASALDELGGVIDSGVMHKLRDGSMSAADAFPLVIEGLNKLEDPTLRMRVGAQLLGTQFEDLGDGAALALDMTQDWAAGSEGAIDKIDQKYTSLSDVSSALWRRMVVSITPATDALLDMANDAVPHIMGAFDRFDAQVGPTMTRIQTVINNVVNFVTRLFGNWRDSVNTDALGPLQYWQEWIDTNLPYLQQIFNTVLGAIQGFWQLFGDDIMHVVNNTFTTIWTVIDTTMRTIGDLVTLALQLLTGDFEGASATLEGIVTRLWDTIVTIFSNQLDSIRTLIGAIDWAGIGSAIMQGIADGIRNGAGRIKDAAEDAAQSAYDAAKRWLGISSPSKKFEELGEFSAEGYAEGIAANISNVGRGLTGGLSNMMGNLQPQPVAAGASFNITVNLSGRASYDDGRQVGRGILDVMRSKGQ